MIHSLLLRNWRAYRRQKFEFSKLNIFVGPNNSGKSSVLSAINFLAQSIQQRDVNSGPIALNGSFEQLGTFLDVVHGNRANTPIDFEVVYTRRDLGRKIIIIDVRGLIRHEWIVTCCGQQSEHVTEWLNNRLIENRIQERASSKSSQVHKKLIQLGAPQRDHKYVHLANSNSAFAIVTNDVDFFDPQAKKPGRRALIRSRRTLLAPFLDFFEKILVSKFSFWNEPWNIFDAKDLST